MSCEKTMKFDIEEFRQRRKTDFEGAWHAGPSVITPPASAGIYPRYTYRRAKVHPIFDTIARLRAAYLSMGFDEAMVPVFIDEQDVYRQFGPEAAAVLDRVYYVGGLPRPNVGISRERLDAIAAITGSTHPAMAPPLPSRNFSGGSTNSTSPSSAPADPNASAQAPMREKTANTPPHPSAQTSATLALCPLLARILSPPIAAPTSITSMITVHP